MSFFLFFFSNSEPCGWGKNTVFLDWVRSSDWLQVSGLTVYPVKAAYSLLCHLSVLHFLSPAVSVGLSQVPVLFLWSHPVSLMVSACQHVEWADTSFVSALARLFEVCYFVRGSLLSWQHVWSVFPLLLVVMNFRTWTCFLIQTYRLHDVPGQGADFCGAVDAEEATYQVVRFCNEGCTRF